MAEVNPPGFLQNAGNIHTAEITRMSIAGLLANAVSSASLVPRGGVHPTLGGVFAVTQNGSPNMSVNVAAGFAFVPGTEGSKQSAYAVLNDAVKNVTIAAADPSQPRIDVIALKVQDSFYSGATNTWSIVAVTGTPAGSPVAPALPANGFKLAQVAVGAGVTSITNANITDFRTYIAAVGGLISVANQTERDALVAHDGLAVWRRDTDVIEVWNGASFTNFSPAFTPYIGEVRATTTRSSTGTEVICATVTFTAVTGARYKVSWYGGVSSTANGDVPRLRIRHQSGASLTTGGTQDASSLQVIQGTNQTTPYVQIATVSGLTGGTQYTIGGTLQRFAGTGTNQISSSVGDEEYLLVERIA